jgi:predicted DNA-binding ribbon-helix-helix protein
LTYPEAFVVIKKRSLVIGEAKTSVSLEDEFWESLRLIAAEHGLPLNRFVEAIAKRASGNLSSALRVTVLEHFISKCESARTGLNTED